jgi:hypothetical protein
MDPPELPVRQAEAADGRGNTARSGRGEDLRPGQEPRENMR